MLCHVTDSLRVAVGDLPTRPVGNLASRTLIRWIVIHSPLKPPPGKVSTAPEMLTSAPTNWSDDLAAAVGLIERVGKGEATATHPSFGRLSRSEWCKLSWKHLDHHLRQFGE